MSKRSRILLPNGCSYTAISVIPKNWKQLKKISGPWRIHYRFYDPIQPAPKQISLKSMNMYTDAADRKEATQLLIESEIEMLKSGFNPFLKKVVPFNRNPNSDIEPETFFISALKKAAERITIEEKYKKHITGYIIPSVEKAARALSLSFLSIQDVKRRHILFILDYLKTSNKGFTNNTFNRFRTDLKILFAELVLLDAADSNIIADIPKKSVIQQPKVTLSDQERIFVDGYLKERHPEFHRFLHVFFHSGARISELLLIKVKDVDLKQQSFQCLIKKGKKKRYVQKTIKTIALPLWTELTQNASPEDYLFSKGLLPGASAIRPDQITKRWYRLIKKKEFDIDGKKTRIEASFYSLKHLHSTEIVERLGDEAAAGMNSHTTTQMVARVYDIRRKQREHDQIKEVNNPFA